MGWLECMSRTAIFSIGSFVGVLMFLTIGIIFMEDDSPHPMTTTTLVIGWIGSILLLIGSLVGAYINRWIALLPGTILIVIALASSILPYLWAVVALSFLLLLQCCKTYTEDRRTEHSNYTDDSDRCENADGNVVTMDIDGAAACGVNDRVRDCSSEMQLIVLG